MLIPTGWRLSPGLPSTRAASPDFSPEVENKAVFRGIIGLL